MAKEKIIQAMFALDRNIDLPEEEARVFLQSRFWLYRHMQSFFIRNESHSRIVHNQNILHDSLAFLVFLLKLPLFRWLNRSPVFLMEHKRSCRMGDRNADPYIGLSEELLREKGVPFIRVGVSRNGIADYINLDWQELYLPYSALFMLSMPLKILQGRVEKESADRIYRAVVNATTFKVDREKYIRKLRYILAYNKLAMKLLSMLNVAKVVCVEAYNSNSSFVRAANARQLQSVEYQHGVISREHIGYNCDFEDQASMAAVLPQKLRTWGEFWCREISDNITRVMKVEPWTYECHYVLRATLASVERNGKILFIMQPSMESDGIEIVNELLSKFGKTRVSVKYHPKQKESLFSEGVTEYFSENIYELLAGYTYIVGFFSTVLFEAISMGCVVYSVKRPQFSGYFDTLQRSGVIMLDSIQEMTDLSRESEVQESEVISARIDRQAAEVV